MNNNRRTFIKNALFVGLGLGVASRPALASSLTEQSAVKMPLFNPDLARIRQLATSVTGALPVGLNVLSIADTERPANIVVKGAEANRKIKLERTAYQLQYADGTIMLDSGMDEATHLTFGKGGNFYPERYQVLQQALSQAKLIAFSHYHGDHVGGVVRSAELPQLAPKVWLNQLTAQQMVAKPHKPTLKISQQIVDQFIVVDFNQYYPIAPGLVAIKSPGHSADSLMFYIKLESGQEFIHSVDIGWSMENIVKQKMKNASWIKEDEKQLQAQFVWLNHLMATEPTLQVLCSHDALQYQDLRRSKVLGDFYIA
ncbi:MBL fold metallo-hydrolase [Ferrimonas senticii]|uniref:MBL fold metallo-hydrolase n=1 Tax=Ferrimonas senticii TaxID=394566 RepID=UPI000407A782|nr:MBL fold metallo-hydrolase [Ferrimonas senticii]